VSKETAEHLFNTLRHDQQDDIGKKLVTMANEFKKVQLKQFRATRENQDSQEKVKY